MKPVFKITYNKPKGGLSEYHISDFIENEKEAFTAYKFKTAVQNTNGVRKFRKDRVIKVEIL